MASFYVFNHLPFGELPKLLVSIAEWLVPGGLLVAALARRFNPGTVEADWLGAPMYFSGYTPAESRRCVAATPYRFDSLAVEADGRVVVAALDRGIFVVEPSGADAELIPMPDTSTTNVCFGGDDLRTAFVTLSERHPVPSMRAGAFIDQSIIAALHGRFAESAELLDRVQPLIVRVPPRLRMPPPSLEALFPLEMVIPEMETTLPLVTW